MNILVISDNYPSRSFPNVGVFVYKFVQQLCKIDHRITVIAPYPIVPRKIRFSRSNYGEELAKVFRPLYFSLSTKQLGGFNTYTIAKEMQIRCIRYIIKRHNIDYDFIYCHFIKNALIAIAALEKYNKPVFAAVGEYKNIDLVQKWYSKAEYYRFLSKIQGFIAVSPFIASKLIDLNIPKEKIIIAPNGVDVEEFSPKDKIQLREKFRFPRNNFIISFIGRFTHDKGPNRILEAVGTYPELSYIFIGYGRQNLSNTNIIFKGKVPYYKVAELLACSDIFVLPTLHEGSNNAIIEAMASGLPIVSSDIPEIREQCNPDFSILVDPMDIDDLRNAILKIKNNEELRESMALNACKYAIKFDLYKRCKNVIQFIEKMIDKCSKNETNYQCR
ncbi:MAG: glycosyltransferase family 4 protein [Bacteroidales bacterium]|nr:glycosyltransferase family 4 protein [Bacteroidales bacterium]